MRYHLFLQYGWFIQNLGKDFIRTNIHTPDCTLKEKVLLLCNDLNAIKIWQVTWPPAPCSDGTCKTLKPTKSTRILVWVFRSHTMYLNLIFSDFSPKYIQNRLVKRHFRQSHIEQFFTWSLEYFLRYVHRPVVPGCAGCAMAHPIFGRSVNPIPTRGDRLCPPNYYWHTLIFIPSDGPG